MRYDFDWTIEREEETFEVYVEGTYRPGTPDAYLEPGDPPEFEIEKITYAGKPFTTTSDEDEAICTWVYENAPDDYDDPYD